MNQTDKAASAHHYTQTGRFNLLSNEQQQQVALLTSAGNVSATWPEGEADYDADMLPSEVAALIRARLAAYLFMSDRDKKTAVLDAIDANALQLDRAFLLVRAEAAEKRAASLRRQIQSIEDEISDRDEAAREAA